MYGEICKLWQRLSYDVAGDRSSLWLNQFRLALFSYVRVVQRVICTASEAGRHHSGFPRGLNIRYNQLSLSFTYQADWK